MNADHSGGRIIEIQTPDHVSLPFRVAAPSARLIALFLDLLVMGAMLLAVALLLLLVVALAGTDASEFITGVVLFLWFVVRNFYFALSELRMQGQTIGKRKMGLRVIARDGGPLTAPMVFARNLTRDIEHFLPLIVLLFPEVLGFSDEGWARAVGAIWLFVLLLLPFFNTHRARAGDLIAGTVVVLAPKGALYRDLVDWVPRTANANPAFEFTQEQLEIYGIKELQVLEEVLRRDDSSAELLWDIAERIKRKIGWNPQYWNVAPHPFLRAFYAAQRRRLEQKMLMGRRQEEKIR